jgi:outer membrane autotransporter protein
VPPVPPVPNIRQEISLYSAIPSMLQTFGLSLLDNLHDRVGEEERLRGCTDLDNDARPNGTWVRIIGQHSAHDGGGVLANGPRFQQDEFWMQAGLDVFRRETDSGHRDHAGFYVAFGQANGSVNPSLNGVRAGDVWINGYTLGGHWTHFGPSGW